MSRKQFVILCAVTISTISLGGCSYGLLSPDPSWKLTDEIPPPKIDLADKMKEGLNDDFIEALIQVDSDSPNLKSAHLESAAYEKLQTTIQGLELAHEVTLNNIANVNTTGFKSTRVIFENQSIRQVIDPGPLDSQDQSSPHGLSVGQGSHAARMQQDFLQGKLTQTDGNLDLAINGHGFFQVEDLSQNQIVYTRAGAFTRNADGNIVFGSANTGRLLEPVITIPLDAIEIAISADGLVSVRQPGNTEMTQIGQIQMTRFFNPTGLKPLGKNLYAQTAASGLPIISNPGQDGMGTIMQGFLEQSNVELREEVMNLKRLQRQLKMLNHLTGMQSFDQ